MILLPGRLISVGKITKIHLEIGGAAKLELGVDESYAINVQQLKHPAELRTAPRAQPHEHEVIVNITAATQFGALHGLTTFGQI